MRHKIVFACVSLIVLTVIPVAVGFRATDGMTPFGTTLGGDFAAFYVAGQILNQYGPSKLYDLNLQIEMYHELVPGSGDQLVYAQGPWLALGFSLLARLPFAWAYVAWIAGSTGMVLSGFSLLWRVARRSIPDELLLPCLLAVLAAEPFLIETVAGGQTSALTFLCISVALAFRSSRPFLAGLALAGLAYKPTLLLLLGPMILVCERGRGARLLAGPTVGLAALVALSLVTLGVQPCLDWLRLLAGYTDASTTGRVAFRTNKYVDAVAFGRLLWPSMALWIAGAVMVTCLPSVLKSWRSPCLLTWCTTIAGTTVVNVYMPAYDVLTVVPAVFVAADILWPLTSWQKRGLLVLAVTPWVSQVAARMIGVQLMTVALAILTITLGREARSHGSLGGDKD